MNAITKEEFWSLAETNKYLRPRWEYSKMVIDHIQKSGFNSCLEIGPRYLPLFSDSDTLDIKQEPACRSVDYLWDCSNAPWPIADKSYDVVVALQVWEHVRRPKKAFREVKRISRNAVLSVPYMWTKKARADKGHMGIGLKKLKQWTGMSPSHYEIVTSQYDKRERPRIVCFYTFGE